jgi:hypothetical protein
MFWTAELLIELVGRRLAVATFRPPSLSARWTHVVVLVLVLVVLIIVDAHRPCFLRGSAPTTARLVLRLIVVLHLQAGDGCTNGAVLHRSLSTLAAIAGFLIVFAHFCLGSISAELV